MNTPVRTVLCGIGGFGEWYLSNVLDKPDSPIEFVGFVDPSPERSSFFERLRPSGPPIFPSLEEFYAASSAELAILASPIQFHCPQTVLALERGSAVLCEKPLCATVQEARAMLDAQRRCGRPVAVGYQHSFTQSARQFKADIIAGVWGSPIGFKCLAHWPRSREYYQRNSWAGRVRDAGGRWVLDSPVNNAVAHYLHHMLYLLGGSPALSGSPVEVTAALGRVHPIENYDTAVLRCRLAGGPEVFFVASHAGARQLGPIFEFRFSDGVVRSESADGDFVGTFRDGTTRNYGKMMHAGAEKIADIAAAVRTGRQPLCGIEAAASHTLVMNGAQKSCPQIADAPPELVHPVENRDGHMLDVDGLNDLLMRSYQAGDFPGEWIKPGSPVDLREWVEALQTLRR